VKKNLKILKKILPLAVQHKVWTVAKAGQKPSASLKEKQFKLGNK
jgi:hypothetical protein